MSKSKHAKPDEFQKEQIRHLKKELIRKDQEIRQLEKELGYSQNRDKNKPKYIEIDEKPDCPDCAKGFLKEVEFIGKIFIVCPLCNFRKKL